MKAANKLVKDRKKGTAPQQKAPPTQKKTGAVLEIENQIIRCFTTSKYHITKSWNFYVVYDDFMIKMVVNKCCGKVIYDYDDIMCE